MTTRDRVLLAALLGGWMLIAWPHIAEQYTTAGQTRDRLGALSWDDRTAALDQPGFRVAQAIAQATPAAGCVLVLAHTGPEHLKYYRARFQYYLYPRGVRFSDRTDAPAEGCSHLAVFRDTAPNLAQEPFRGHWDEDQLRRRTAAMQPLAAAPQVEIFR